MKLDPVISGADRMTTFLTRGSKRYYKAREREGVVDEDLATTSIPVKGIGKVSLTLHMYSSSVLAVNAQVGNAHPRTEIVTDAEYGNLGDIVDATKSAFDSAVQDSSKQEEIIRAVANEHDLEVKITADPEHIPNGAVSAGKYPYPENNEDLAPFIARLVNDLKRLGNSDPDTYLAFFGADNLYIYDLSGVAQEESRFAA